MMTQSVSWWCFTPRLMAPEAFVRAVVTAGLPAIDLVPPEYWDLVRTHGLVVSSFRGHETLEVGLNQRDQHARIEAELRLNIELAARIGCPTLVCFSGNRNGLGDAEGAHIAAEAHARGAPVAEAAAVTLVLELLNSKVDHPDYQADHTAWGVDVCRMVGSPRVKLLYDIYHMQIMEGDIIRTIRAYHPFIGHYHTAGNPGRSDLDETQELYYPAILRAIAATGFNGVVAHEFLPKGEPVEALRRVADFCAPYLTA